MSFREQLRDVPDDYYPVPWWAWTGIMRRSRMQEQMRLMHAQGVREFFIFALYGLQEPQFLSDKYFELVEFTLRYARTLNMKVWIYDDFNWPSGCGGGLFLRKHPEYRAWVMASRRTTLQVTQSICMESAPLWCAVIQGNNGLRTIEVEANSRTWEYQNNSSQTEELIWIELHPYEATIAGSNGGIWSYGQRGIVDSLNAQAVSSWVDFTYGEYQRRFPDYFGNVLKGFFFDEPQARPREVGSAPYTPKLFADFQVRYGYDLRGELGALFLDLPSSDRVRVDFWELITEYFSSNFTTTIANWCHKNKVISTGHCVDEETINQKIQVASNGDIAAALAPVAMPGMNLLRDVSFYQDDTDPAWRRNQAYTDSLLLSAKRISAIKRYNHRSRCMCEAFGTRDWNATMAQQKKSADFLFACGIDFLNDNSLIYTISDFRKRGISGKHFTQPWWSLYRHFMDYAARLSFFAASGELDSHIGVVFPTRLNYRTCNLGNEDAVGEAGNIAGVLNKITAILTWNHVDYEIVFENILKNAKFENGKFLLPNAVFDTIIIPIEADSEISWEEFSAAGGRIITIDATGSNLEQLNSIQSICRIYGENSDGVISALRKIDGDHWLFAANQTPGDKELKITHATAVEAEIFDPETGDFTAADFYNGQIALKIVDSGACIIHFGSQSKQKPTAENRSDNLEIQEIPITGDWDFQAPDGNNYLPQTALFPEDSKWSIALNHGRSPLAFSIQEATFFYLKGDFYLGFIPEKLEMFFDSKLVESLTVNDKLADFRTNKTLYDHENIAFDITNLVTAGENQFCAKVKNSPWNNTLYHLPFDQHLYDSPILHGSFTVGDNGELLPETGTIPLGSWTQNGYGFYAGRGIYRKKIFLAETNFPTGAYLHIGEFFATAEVKVNGHEAGVRVWMPGRFDLSKWLQPGENLLEITICNSLGNLLCRGFDGKFGMRKEAGLLGPVKLFIS